MAQGEVMMMMGVRALRTHLLGETEYLHINNSNIGLYFYFLFFLFMHFSFVCDIGLYLRTSSYFSFILKHVLIYNKETRFLDEMCVGVCILEYALVFIYLPFALAY